MNNRVTGKITNNRSNDNYCFVIIGILFCWYTFDFNLNKFI